MLRARANAIFHSPSTFFSIAFVDTFARPPRSLPPRPGVLERTLSAVNTYLFSKPPDANRMRQPTVSRSGKGKMSEAEEAAQRLPRTWEVMGEKERAVRRGAGGVRKAVVIGVHG